MNDWLYKWTSVSFEWAILCETSLTTLFWGYLYGVLTPTHEMSWYQIFDKLHYDVILDKENWNHWIPFVLLLIEFCFNNIPFPWRHLPIFMLINSSYILVHLCYCEIKKTQIYPGLDPVNNPE